MTEPTTPAGRAPDDTKTWEALVYAIHAYIADRTTTNWTAVEDAMQRRDDYHRAAIEEQARAEGRREAAQEIREAVNTADHPSRTNDEIVALVRDAVAHRGRSSDPDTDEGRRVIERRLDAAWNELMSDPEPREHTDTDCWCDPFPDTVEPTVIIHRREAEA